MFSNIFDLWLVESVDVETMDIVGQLYSQHLWMTQPISSKLLLHATELAH